MIHNMHSPENKNLGFVVPSDFATMSYTHSRLISDCQNPIPVLRALTAPR
jgi:hypothetical protein